MGSHTEATLEVRGSFLFLVFLRGAETSMTTFAAQSSSYSGGRF